MEIGALFILVIVVGVVAVGGILLYGVAWKLRNEKLHPKRDKLQDGAGGMETAPEHVRVSNEQRARFVTDR
jgi:hypothetical protein